MKTREAQRTWWALLKIPGKILLLLSKNKDHLLAQITLLKSSNQWINLNQHTGELVTSTPSWKLKVLVVYLVWVSVTIDFRTLEEIAIWPTRSQPTIIHSLRVKLSRSQSSIGLPRFRHCQSSHQIFRNLWRRERSTWSWKKSNQAISSHSQIVCYQRHRQSQSLTKAVSSKSTNTC